MQQASAIESVAPPPLRPGDITGLVLAGGRGARMGGLDKGLQAFKGAPLALNALRRLQLQQGGWVSATLVNANRHATEYEAFGSPVWPDPLPDFAGPLAGFLCGLQRSRTPWLLTVPCDSPLFPLDLAQRLAQAVVAQSADIGMVFAPEADGRLLPQPVFCLLHTGLMAHLNAHLQAGGRKIDHWTGQHRVARVAFNAPSDDPQAFCNVNTLAELQALQ